ncbi:MAG: DMT family transporter [Betaproteobacteria bacterium]|nr:DMT family transporter [Betaproteobacteria bacterium]
MRAPGVPLAYLLLALAVLFWSGNWIVGRMLADLVPPVALTFWRWVIALALLAPVVAPRLWRHRAMLVREWKPVVVIGLLGGGLHNVLQYWGLQYTTATNGSLLNPLASMFIIVLGAVVLRDPFPRAAALGACISLAGALAIVTRLDPGVILALQFNTGDLLIIVSLLLLAGYTLALRWRPAGLDQLSFLACFALVALAPVGLCYVFEYAAGARMVLNATSVGGMLYIAVFPALLAYLFWSIGVPVVGAARAGIFMHLMPVFGSLMGIVFLGEKFEAHHAAGMALIFSGLAIAARGRAA